MSYDNGGVLPAGISTFVTGPVVSVADYAELQAKYDILTEEYNELKRRVEDGEDY